MKPEPLDPLLAAVLDPDEIFRRNTLTHTLALARRRRRNRVAGRVLAATSVLAVAALLFRPTPPAPVPEPIAATPALRVVRTAPLAAGESVRTRDAHFVRVSTSEFAPVAKIETRTHAPMLDYLSDEQLLAAFPGQHPALIAPGTEEARLVFY